MNNYEVKDGLTPSERWSYLKQRYHALQDEYPELGAFPIEKGKTRRAIGQCKFKSRHSGAIFISWPFIQVNDLEKMWKIIAHEAAHALASIHDNARDHDRKFKRWARRLNAPEGHAVDFVNAPELKYTVSCVACGYEVGYSRKPKYEMSCAKCSPGRFDPSKVMKIKVNW